VFKNTQYKLKTIKININMQKVQRFKKYLNNARAKKTVYEPTHQAATLAYNFINEAAFNNRLSRPNIIIRRIKDAWGMCWQEEYYCSKIELAHKFESKEQFIAVMAHEMVHQYQIDVYGRMSHGETFQNWKPYFKEKFGLRI
jgi:hypothetical protein